jgi:16S rRNA (uracil1498-N3)-methyltransferase
VTPPLFLVDGLPPGERFLLGGDEGRHAARVRRLRRGEELLVSDGRGGLARCRVADLAADGLDLQIVSREQVPPADPRIVVVQALAKGERGELAVEAMTELGVDEIVPWAASRSITQWRGARADKALDRWRRTAREAAKQSRRAWVPTVAGVADQEEARIRVTAAAGALVLHEEARHSIVDVPLPGADDIVVVVGPEGGISPAEIAVFADAGAVPVRLGDTVLRTSTAGPAALAALSLRLGRWN